MSKEYFGRKRTTQEKAQEKEEKIRISKWVRTLWFKHYSSLNLRIVQTFNLVLILNGASEEAYEDEDDEEGEDPALDSLSAAIQFQVSCKTN